MHSLISIHTHISASDFILCLIRIKKKKIKEESYFNFLMFELKAELLISSKAA